MRHRRGSFALIGVAYVVGAGLVACGLTTSGIVTDTADDSGAVGETSSDSTLSDSAPEASDDGASSDAGEASSDGGEASTDANEAGVDASTGPIVCPTVATGVTNCASCPGFPSICPGSGKCVSSCHDQCDGGPIECFSCGVASPPVISTCATVAVGCPSAAPYGPCPCPGNTVALCPGDAQVCASNLCIACGESSSDGKACHSQSCKAGGGDNPKYTCY